MTGLAAATEPFAVADELTCYYDHPGEPANVHVEVGLPGRLDQDALRAAAAALLGAEPGLRARRASASPWQRRFRWEFAARPDADPVQAASYAGQADLDRQRDAFLSVPPPLDTAPPFLLLLASGPGGDCLLLNAHHARFDGLACLRLLTDLGTAYGRATGAGPAGTGQADSAAPGKPGHGRQEADAARSVGPWPGRPRPARGPGGPATRIAPGQGLGGRPRTPGYGAFLLTWEGSGLASAARGAGASVNDALITALMLTVTDWNASRRPAAGPGLIRITMPVGDRAQGGPDGAWANRSRLTAVAARVGAGAEPAALLAEVAAQTAAAKRREGPQVGVFSRALTAAPAPAAVKHAALRSAVRIAGPVVCDTALLSNLGPVEPPVFGDLPASQVWFSTSAHLPRGLSVGAVSSAGRLRLTFRYRRALLSAADAADFAGRYGKALDQLASSKAGN